MILSDTKFRWIVSALILVAIFEFLSLTGKPLPALYAIPLFTIIILIIGYRTILHGLQALFSLNFKSINLLMILAVAGAYYLGKYEEAAVVIVLYTLAERLEDIGIAKSKSAIALLVEKLPKYVFVKGINEPIPVKDVKVDQVIVVKPFEMIPLDGQVVEGNSAVDESTITGEPIPQDKIVGDKVFAGTQNKQGYLEVKVKKEYQNTTLAKIQEITYRATKSKAKTQQFIETFSQYYTPNILILSILWLFLGVYVWEKPFNQQLLESLTLIVIACPCALVISTPISIYSAIGNASSQGALIKGGRYLEAIGKINAMAFDKTRTLTYGKPILTDVIPFSNYSREELLSCAAGIELYSEHPLAQSIVDAASKEKFVPHKIENFQSIVGKGAKADCMVCYDKHHCIGKLQFILEEHHVPEPVLKKIEELQNEGKTVIVISTHREIKGVLGVTDELKPESSNLVEELKSLGIASVMLTGDHEGSAKAVAEKLGFKEFRAELLPQQKAQIIKELENKYGLVAMVGDGVNDAPALAVSSVGISMGSIGSDAALEAASIVIMSDHLKLLPYLVKLGRRTIRLIQFNTFWAVTVKLIFIALGLAGMSNLAMAIFADVGVTTLVILNSLRLMK